MITGRLFALLLVLFISLGSQAETTEACLSTAQGQPHRLEREEQIQKCFELNQQKIQGQRCFNLALSLKSVRQSVELSEALNSICFYNIDSFKDVKTCLNQAKYFKIADHHDEAVFHCYRQFQNQMSAQQCIQLSRQMIYPAKKNYLFSHCKEL